MRRVWMSGIFAVAALWFGSSGAFARTPDATEDLSHALHPHYRLSHYRLSQRGRPHHHLHNVYLHNVEFGRWAASSRVRRGHGRRYAALVGEPGTGLGFYALPMPVRVGAWRYRMAHARPYWQNPVRFAVAADAARYPDWVVGPNGYRYGVFDPIEGYGSPFFAGYYGPAGDDDEPPPPPFGRPYR